MSKRLLDLNPSIGKHPDKPNWWCLSFDCPTCGPPYRIAVNTIEGSPPDQTQALWSISFGDTQDIRESLTIVPSINNHRPMGHGRKKSCSWHGNITNGIVVNA